MKPEKPKHYWRDHTVILALSLLAGLLAVKLGYKWASPSVSVLLVVLIPNLWFRKYNAECAEYEKVKLEQYIKPDKIDVDANIEKYLREKKLKRENAKWREFWV